MDACDHNACAVDICWFCRLIKGCASNGPRRRNGIGRPPGNHQIGVHSQE